MEKTTESISKRVKHFMVDEGLNQTAMSQKLGMALPTFNKKLNGITDWKWSEILKLCGFLDVTPDELTGFAH